MTKVAQSNKILNRIIGILESISFAVNVMYIKPFSRIANSTLITVSQKDFSSMTSKHGFIFSFFRVTFDFFWMFCSKFMIIFSSRFIKFFQPFGVSLNSFIVSFTIFMPFLPRRFFMFLIPLRLTSLVFDGVFVWHGFYYTKRRFMCQ